MHNLHRFVLIENAKSALKVAKSSMYKICELEREQRIFMASFFAFVSNRKNWSAIRALLFESRGTP